jgi:hypothetical protein
MPNPDEDRERGNQSFAAGKTGANLLTEEDFFASSPSANLVGDNEEGRDSCRHPGREVCASRLDVF